MLTQNRLKQLLHYDKDTGLFTRRVSRRPFKKGSVAGSHGKDGYVELTVDGKAYRSHRLAFLYVEGYFPEHQVDHKNGVNDDNRWENLRHATRACNMQNQKKNIRNTSGFPGVSFYKTGKRWRAGMRLSGKEIYLGRHDTRLDAALARLTGEVWEPDWTCNHRGELVKAIKKAWPEFNPKSLN